MNKSNSFKLSDKVNPNKVFILKKSEMGKRFDPFYYIPELVALEKKVQSKNQKRLRDYVLLISSGATPKTTESEKYYSDVENGIPFLRVQNVTEFGLDISDCKFINEQTHEKDLKRSQVFENDLLVTITGRIGSASVAPENFEGNINQHSVVIKTKDKETSDVLATYFNSSIGQKLLLRRTSGGTRPALDYQALLSVPIIYDEKILEIKNKVFEKKKQNDHKAEKLLASIDNYLLKELGITLPEEPENILKNRMFKVSSKEISGGRFDSYYHQAKFNNNINAISNGKYQVKTLYEIIAGNLIKGTLPNHEEKEGNNSVVQINCIKVDGTISLEDVLTAKDIFTKQQKLKLGDVLIVITGATIGKTAQWNYEGEYFLGGDIVKFQTNSLADNSFVFHFLRSTPVQTEIKRNITGATNGHLAPEDIKHLLIPLPPLSKQIEIAGHITLIREEAKKLKEQTKEELAIANKEIEKILLGE